MWVVIIIVNLILISDFFNIEVWGFYLGVLGKLCGQVIKCEAIKNIIMPSKMPQQIFIGLAFAIIVDGLSRLKCVIMYRN